MTRHRLGLLGLVLAAFAAGLAVTFPTDAIVRGLLARVPLPAEMRLSFAAAHLRPSGLRLDDVHLLRRDGGAALAAEWVHLRPSPRGFWRDRTGRPWTVSLAICGGTIDILLGGDGAATPVTMTLDHVDVAACLPYLAPHLDGSGQVSGTVHVRLAPRDPASGDGSFEVRSAAWRPGGALEDLAIRADTASLRGRLGDGRLDVEVLDAVSDDFRARGRGSVRFATPRSDSVLDLRVAVTPGRTMPPVLRRWFDGVPGAAPDPSGTRTLRLQGTIGNPRLAAIGTLE